MFVTARELEKHVVSDKEIEQLSPVASTTVALAAPELVTEGAPPLEIVPGSAGLVPVPGNAA